MGLCANLLANDNVNYEFAIICRAVNGFICAIAQAVVKLISNVTAKVTGYRQGAADRVWVPGGGIVPAIAYRYTVRNQIENGEIDDLFYSYLFIDIKQFALSPILFTMESQKVTQIKM